MFLMSNPLVTKAPIREHLCHFYALLLTVLSMTMTGSSLKVLCIYVLWSQKELVRYHLFVLLHVVLIEVLTFETYYYLLAS